MSKKEFAQKIAMNKIQREKIRIENILIAIVICIISFIISFFGAAYDGIPNNKHLENSTINLSTMIIKEYKEI